MTKDETKKLWSSRDIVLSATLITLGFPMIKITYQTEGLRNQAVGYFYFEDSEKLRDTEREFTAKKLAIEPREFSENIRFLKSQITNKYKSPDNVVAEKVDENVGE